MKSGLRNTVLSAGITILALTATGCSDSPDNTDQPGSEPQPAASSSPSSTDQFPSRDDDQAAAPEPLYPTASALADPSDEQLRQIALGPAPRGTGPQIALRFLQALQAGDDLAADRELFIAGRTLLAIHDRLYLRQLMDDIRSNAGLDTAGPCTSARSLHRDSALVSCGTQRVVVHVLSGLFGSGVQISDAHPYRDHFRGKHTHAYTTLQP